MRAPYSVPGTFVLLLFLLVPQSGHSLLISGTGTWGIFEGSITYNCEQASGEGTLIVELTNTSPADNGGYLTGFAFNNPGGCVAGVTFSDADFELLGAPSFADGVSAVPLGHFDIGAAPGGSWLGGGNPALGIAVGQTKTFIFAFAGTNLCELDDLSFVSELSEGGSDFFAARFRGFENGQSDKVPADELTVPVTLSSFTAIAHQGYIDVNWTSQSEVNALAYHLYRGEHEYGQYLEIARLDAQGNSESPRDYHFVDQDVVAGLNYYYKLAAEDCQGNVEFHEPVLASAATAVPGTYSLMPNYPNPFNASTVIGYQLPVSGQVTLAIYDVLGRKVRTLLNAYREAGNYTARWDSEDDRGGELKSGVYFCVFETGDFSQTRKMVLTR